MGAALFKSVPVGASTVFVRGCPYMTSDDFGTILTPSPKSNAALSMKSDLAEPPTI